MSRSIALSVILVALPCILGQDNIGFSNGTYSISTQNWDALFVKDSGTLASLKPKGSNFDFLPYDLMLLNRRVQNGCYHWGDINIRYRTTSSPAWIESSSATLRKPVLEAGTEALVSSGLSPTMPLGPLNITREWIDVAGDLGLQFTITNTGDDDVEIGALGFPAAVNNIFTKRHVSDVNEKCSFMEPYIGQDAGHLRVLPLNGVGSALVVTPLETTPLEAYRWLWEDNKGETRIGSNMWEGFFEWTVHSKAFVENEWKDAEPWNPPSSHTLAPGDSRRYGVRFTAVGDGVRQFDTAIRKTGTPNAISVPGYIIPRGTRATLKLQTTYDIVSISAYPSGALEIVDNADKTYIIQPSPSAWGRVRLAIVYDNNSTQTIHYYITKPASETIRDLGHFLTTKHWYVDELDPFGRSPSIMGYDGESQAIVEQDTRLAPAGLSDEGGAGAYVAAAVKQSFQPDQEEVSKLEAFVDRALFRTVQDASFAVKRGIFYFDPELDYNYTITTGPKKDLAYETDRAYNYVWPAATYWSLYRAGRSRPGFLKNHDWAWYLDQAFKTVMRGMGPDIGFHDKGLMGETIFGNILLDLHREGRSSEAADLGAVMRKRVDQWLTEPYPYGSEQSWDSTGQEGVYFWSKFFGENDLAERVKTSVLGYVTTVPHWGYNGNARRYWDFVVAGKLQIVERQIHHYGSGLNALVMLSAFKDDPSDHYLLRVGYGGTTGPLTNIRQDGFASCAMHAWPEHLSWDGFSGDYGPNFVGMVLGSGTYLVEDPDFDPIAYGGTLSIDGDLVTVKVLDPVRQKVFVGPVGVEISIDAGIIEEFALNLKSYCISLRLGQLETVPKAESTVIWITATPQSARAATAYKVTTGGVEAEKARQGSKIAYHSDTVEVLIE